MIPRTLHHVWFGEHPMPERLQKWVKSTMDMNPEWGFMVWDEKTISPDWGDFDYLKEHLHTWASVSNWIRLNAVNDFGGVYLDCDVECIKPLDNLLDYHAFAARQDTDRLCNAVFGAESGHPWIKWQIAHARKRMSWDANWGVALMSEAPRDGLTVIPTEWVYPWLWTTPKEQRIIKPDTLLVHHWEMSWVPNEPDHLCK